MDAALFRIKYDAFKEINKKATEEEEERIVSMLQRRTGDTTLTAQSLIEKGYEIRFWHRDIDAFVGYAQRFIGSNPETKNSLRRRMSDIGIRDTMIDLEGFVAHELCLKEFSPLVKDISSLVQIAEGLKKQLFLATNDNVHNTIDLTFLRKNLYSLISKLVISSLCINRSLPFYFLSLSSSKISQPLGNLGFLRRSSTNV